MVNTTYDHGIMTLHMVSPEAYENYKTFGLCQGHPILKERDNNNLQGVTIHLTMLPLKLMSSMLTN